MSEPSNPNSPWRLMPTITPTRPKYDDEIDFIPPPTTKEQRDYARKRLARIDVLRQQQRRNRNRQKQQVNSAAG